MTTDKNTGTIEKRAKPVAHNEAESHNIDIPRLDDVEIQRKDHTAQHIAKTNQEHVDL